MRKVIVIALALLLPVGGWLLLVRHEFGKLEPKGHTVAEHLATMPEPEGFVVFEVASRGDHLAVHGPIPALLTFPSGGPIYIFGPSGELQDWTSDGGDDDKFHHRWPGVYGGRKVNREVAAAWPGGQR
jgi:hypothetical protein